MKTRDLFYPYPQDEYSVDHTPKVVHVERIEGAIRRVIVYIAGVSISYQRVRGKILPFCEDPRLDDIPDPAKQGARKLAIGVFYKKTKQQILEEGGQQTFLPPPQNKVKTIRTKKVIQKQTKRLYKK